MRINSRLEQRRGRKTARCVALATSTLCVMEITSVAWAQDAPAEPEKSEGQKVERVVVTATKRREDLKDVPQAITVLNQNQLDNINSDSLETFGQYVPGLEVQAFSPGQTRITIRGISPDEQTGLSTVSYYLDEIPMSAFDQRSQPQIRLYDIDRVEVLRGPQGTLYGEGAMGGTVRIITNKPDTTEFYGSAKGAVYAIEDGDIGYKLNAMANLPIIEDQLALRVVVENREDAGWIDNYLLTIPDPAVGGAARYDVDHIDEDANHSTTTNVRATLRFTPSEVFTIDATYIYDDLDVHTSNIADVDLYTHRDLGLRPSTSRSDLWNLTASYDLDIFTLTSTSSYTTRETSRSTPQEPILLPFAPFFPNISSFTVAQEGVTDTFTQEVRAVSDSDQRFRWTIGGYYRKGEDTSAAQATGYVPATDETVPLYGFGGTTNFKSYAVFGEAEFDVTEALTLIGGARWFEEEDKTSGLERTAEKVTPKATVRYEFSDQLMAYATYAEGYRSGGFNFNAGPPTYAPDTTQNYELGAKYVSEDGRLSISGAIYQIDWGNMQFVQLDAGGFLTFIGNANEASAKGIEAEIAYRAENGFWLQVGGNVTEAQLESDVFGNFTGIIPKGRALPAVPDYKLSAIIGYGIPVLENASLDLSAGVSFIGGQTTKLEDSGTYTDPLFGGVYVIGSTIDPYASGTVRAELNMERWSAALYVTNIWNEETPVGNDNFLPALGQPLYWMQPRTIGLEVSSHF